MSLYLDGDYGQEPIEDDEDESEPKFRAHFEIVALYGSHETLLGRKVTRGEAESFRHEYAGSELYKHIVVRQVE